MDPNRVGVVPATPRSALTEVPPAPITPTPTTAVVKPPQSEAPVPVPDSPALPPSQPEVATVVKTEPQKTITKAPTMASLAPSAAPSVTSTAPSTATAQTAATNATEAPLKVTPNLPVRESKTFKSEQTVYKAPEYTAVAVAPDPSVAANVLGHPLDKTWQLVDVKSRERSKCKRKLTLVKQSDDIILWIKIQRIGPFVKPVIKIHAEDPEASKPVARATYGRRWGASGPVKASTPGKRGMQRLKEPKLAKGSPHHTFTWEDRAFMWRGRSLVEEMNLADVLADASQEDQIHWYMQMPQDFEVLALAMFLGLEIALEKQEIWKRRSAASGSVGPTAGGPGASGPSCSGGC